LLIISTKEAMLPIWYHANVQTMETVEGNFISHTTFTKLCYLESSSYNPSHWTLWGSNNLICPRVRIISDLNRVEVDFLTYDVIPAKDKLVMKCGMLFKRTT